MATDVEPEPEEEIVGTFKVPMIPHIKDRYSFKNFMSMCPAPRGRVEARGTSRRDLRRKHFTPAGYGTHPSQKRDKLLAKLRKRRGETETS